LSNALRLFGPAWFQCALLEASSPAEICFRSVWRPFASAHFRPFRRQPDLINDSGKALAPLFEDCTLPVSAWQAVRWMVVGRSPTIGTDDAERCITTLSREGARVPIGLWIEGCWIQCAQLSILPSCQHVPTMPSWVRHVRLAPNPRTVPLSRSGLCHVGLPTCVLTQSSNLNCPTSAESSQVYDGPPGRVCLLQRT
jgi:hypothetical protein